MTGTEAIWTTSHRYEPIPSCAEDARRFLRDATAHVAVDQEALVLAASELITNAIRHAQTPFTVSVGIRTDRLRVGVTDASSRLPVLRPIEAGNEGGLGLHIVNRLAQAWGADSFSGGKTVWFETPIINSEPL